MRYQLHPEYFSAIPKGGYLGCSALFRKKNQIKKKIKETHLRAKTINMFETYANKGDDVIAVGLSQIILINLLGIFCGS